MIKEQFARKCRRLGKKPGEVLRQLMKNFVSTGKRHAHDGLYHIIEEIDSSSGIYHLLRAQMGSEWASLDALCHVLHIEGIDRSVLLNAMGKGAQSLVTIEEVARLFWERSNFGMGDLCVSETEAAVHEIEPDSVVLLPSYRFFNIAMRNVRRRIQLCEFFAIKLHRWYSFAVRPSDLRQMRQLSLFSGL